MREFLSFVLTPDGYDIVLAADGEEALAYVRKHFQEQDKRSGIGVDLVIMDIKMPPPGGIEVMRQLRELDPDTVVILITGYASLDTAIQAVRYGAYDYLTKPLDNASDLLAVVQRALDKRRLLVNNRRLLHQLRYAYEENLRLLEEMQDLNRDLELRIAERTRELEQANRRLKGLDRLKSELLANVSHELYTPLNAVIGFSQALLDGLHGQLSSAQGRLVESIHGSGQRLRASFDDLIDMAQLSASEVTIYPQSVSLRAVLEGTKSLLERSVKEKKLRVVLEMAPNIETVWADEAKLKRMLYELLSNAVKFTPEGGQVTLEAALYPAEQPSELRLAVSDTGVGVASEDLEEIFDPFRQVDSSLSRRFGGMGLGLALVRHYAELHGGRVWAESEPGLGSTFTLGLPLMPARNE